jgi:osmoprotectant transport system permease protein
LNFHNFIQHLSYVFFSVLLTIAVGVPVGVCAYFFPRARRPILSGVQVLQTIPSLALLGIIMVFLGAGAVTVMAGLVLYSLLPVVQNTYVGLSEVDPALLEVSRGMGMTRFYRLIHVELPIALPLIFAGIRIAAVTSVSIAIFAAFVGGGGLGSVIYQGIRVHNMTLILTGALTLMVMAVVFDTVLGFVEKRLLRKQS